MIKSCFFNIAIFFILLSHNVFASQMRPYTTQEKQLMDRYKESSFSLENFRNSEIYTYILKNIQDYAGIYKTHCSVSMIIELEHDHQILYEDCLINLAVYLIAKGIVTTEEKEWVYLKSDYKEEFNAHRLLNQIFFVISSLRTEKSISFLMNLIYPIEQWKKPSFDVIKNVYTPLDNKGKVLEGVRRLALGQIFQPLDKFGEMKIPEVKAIVQCFPDSDPTKAKMLKSMENWELIYSGKAEGVPYKP